MIFAGFHWERSKEDFNRYCTLIAASFSSAIRGSKTEMVVGNVQSRVLSAISAN
jgi:hypothetical protein